MYRIRDWDALYENAASRKRDRLAWVPVPNRHDGDGYVELVDHEDGASHLGVWLTLLQVASRARKADRDGSLRREGGRPHDAASLARKTRLPQATVAAALARLVSIGWVEDASEVAPAATQRPLVQTETVPSSKGKERKGKETEEHPRPSGSARAMTTKEIEERCERIYGDYPRHIAPKKAKEAILRAAKRLVQRKRWLMANGNWIEVANLDDAFNYLANRTVAFKLSPLGKSKPKPGERDFRPYPATWFNQERYEDDPKEWSVGNEGAPKPDPHKPREGDMVAGKTYHKGKWRSKEEMDDIAFNEFKQRQNDPKEAAHG